MKKYFLILLGSLNLVILLFSTIYGIGPSPPTTDHTIKVMSYNIHLFYDEGIGGENNLVEVRELISQSEASIVGLQESEGNRLVSSNQHGVKWLAKQLNMYAYYGPDSKDDAWGVSILSFYPILSAESIHLPSENALNRVAVVAELEVELPSAPTIHVIVTHLSYLSKQDQNAQIDKIIEITSTIETPFLLLGDFNLVLGQQLDELTLEEDPAYQRLNDTYRDGWVEAGGSFDESTSYFFLEDETVPNSRIDYIWLSDEWIVSPSSAQILGDRSISDHRAVMITLTL